MLLCCIGDEFFGIIRLKVTFSFICKCVVIFLQNESPTAAALKKMLIALSVPKPPSNIDPAMLFSKLKKKVWLLLYLKLIKKVEY